MTEDEHNQYHLEVSLIGCGVEGCDWGEGLTRHFVTLQTPPEDLRWGDIRYRYRGKERVIVLGPAEFHPVGFRHAYGSDTSSRPFHEDTGRWCVPIAVYKGGWSNYWAPRWWSTEDVWTPEQVIAAAEETMNRDIDDARRRFEGTIKRVRGG